MIYDLERGFAAIHIPRCAGVAIARALRPYLSDHCLVDLLQRHWPAWQIKDRLGTTWDRLYRFAVIRNPFEIIESDWRLTLAGAKQLDTDSWAQLRPSWFARLQRAAADPSLKRFVREEYLGEYSGVKPDGFWRTYCLRPNGEDLGVEAVRFESLPDRWPGLCDRLGVPRCELPRVNHAPGPAPDWPAKLRQEVEALCDGDLARL